MFQILRHSIFIYFFCYVTFENGTLGRNEFTMLEIVDFFEN